jgi:hypothetical protein
MIRPTGIAAPTRASGATRAKGAQGGFRLAETDVSGSAPTPAPEPTQGLSALIELQGAATREEQRRRKVAAAQWTLSLLDRLRLSLLEGAHSGADLEALAAAAERSGDVEDDADLRSTLDSVALRARVELAKRGR